MREKLKVIFIVVTLIFMGIMCLPGVNTWGKEGHGEENQHDHSAMGNKGNMQHHQDETGLTNVHLTQIPVALQNLQTAEKAIQSNDTKASLLAVKQVKKQLAAVKQTTGKHIQPLILNSKCPIMEGEISPAKLTSETVSPYKEKFVAFCCDGCKPDWDKLSDVEKEARLSKVSSQSARTGSSHQPIRVSKPGKDSLCTRDRHIPASDDHRDENPSSEHIRCSENRTDLSRDKQKSCCGQ